MTRDHPFPWDLLDLDPYEADERAVKAAYAKLLKKTRPDDDPDGFMRLREARDKAIEELGYGWWDERSDDDDYADLRETEEDFDLEEFTWFSQPQPAIAWVRDTARNAAVGIGAAQTLTLDWSAAQRIVQNAFADPKTAVRKWKKRNGEQLCHDLEALTSGGRLVPKEADPNQRYSRALGFLRWFCLRPDHGWGSAEQRAFHDKLHLLEQGLAAAPDPDFPAACYTPLQQEGDAPHDRPEFAPVIALYRAWRNDETSIASDRFHAAFGSLATQFDTHELRAYAPPEPPPEILIGCMAATLSNWMYSTEAPYAPRGLSEFVEAAAAACGAISPVWLTPEAMTHIFGALTEPWLWRYADEPDVAEAVDYAAAREEQWRGKADAITEADIEHAVRPIVSARAGFWRGRALDFGEDEDDQVRASCQALGFLLGERELLPAEQAYTVGDLFLERLGLSDEEDDEDYDDEEGEDWDEDVDWSADDDPVRAGLHELVSADRPAPREAWEALLDDPSVADIDSAIDLEQWLRQAILDKSGYWEDVTRPIPGFGAAQALLLQERYGWGDPKSMATWDRDEREAITKLYELSESRPLRSLHRREDPRGSPADPGEDQKSGNSFWRIVAWVGVGFLLIKLVQLFSADG